MAYMMASKDESNNLDLDIVIEILASNYDIKQIREDPFGGAKITCTFFSGNKSPECEVDIYVFDSCISLEGYDQPVFEFALWFQKAYQRPLVFFHPEGRPVEIDLSSIHSVEELSYKVQEELS